MTKFKSNLGYALSYLCMGASLLLPNFSSARDESGLETKMNGFYSSLSDDSVRGKQPLDLPSGGKGADDDEEDTSETITFYGGDYEGDGFFFCLDRSGSMGGYRIVRLKQEVTGAINSLSERSEFGIVDFNSSDYSYFRPEPTEATRANKNLANFYVQALVANGGTELLEAGIYTVGLSHRSNKRNRSMIFVGDGNIGSDPQGIISAITTANVPRIPLNTLFIGNDPYVHYEQLSSANGGTFRRVD